MTFRLRHDEKPRGFGYTAAFFKAPELRPPEAQRSAPETFKRLKTVV